MITAGLSVCVRILIICLHGESKSRESIKGFGAGRRDML